MKKLITILLTMALTLSFVACGNDNNNAADDNNNNNNVAEDNNGGAATGNTGDMNDDDDRNEIDENIDAVAKHLGLKDGEDTLYEVIGAKAGKEFNGGKVEIYQFDDDSAEYEKLKKGEGDLKIAAHNDGFVLLFANDKDKDEDLIKRFEDIDFK